MRRTPSTTQKTVAKTFSPAHSPLNFFGGWDRSGSHFFNCSFVLCMYVWIQQSSAVQFHWIKALPHIGMVLTDKARYVVAFRCSPVKFFGFQLADNCDRPNSLCTVVCTVAHKASIKCFSSSACWRTLIVTCQSSSSIARTVIIDFSFTTSLGLPKHVVSCTSVHSLWKAFTQQQTICIVMHAEL